MKDRLASFRFDSGKPGPRLLMLGAIHGNEVCGTIALARLRLELETGILALTSGSLTLAPICNPLAYKAQTRFVKANLNRIIARSQPQEHGEQVYAHQVMDLIDECDIVLDLHSNHAGRGPYIMVDYMTESNRDMALAQRLPDWVSGWAELYAGMPGLNAGDTTQYANETGRHGVLIECGQHEDPAAAVVAYQCCLRTLRHYGMIEAGPVEEPITPVVHRAVKVIVKDRPGRFTQDWHDLDPVREGDVLAVYEDGETLLSPLTGSVLLPFADASLGAEWIYLAVPERV